MTIITTVRRAGQRMSLQGSVLVLGLTLSILHGLALAAPGDTADISIGGSVPLQE